MAMFDTDPEAVDRLAQRMVRAIDFRHTSPATALAACANVMAFCLSLVCAGCRARLADELRRCVPQMVTEAADLAEADDPTEEHQRVQH